jgi:hypothetical protein
MRKIASTDRHGQLMAPRGDIGQPVWVVNRGSLPPWLQNMQRVYRVLDNPLKFVFTATKIALGMVVVFGLFFLLCL